MRLEYDEACKMMRRAVQLGGELPWVQQVCVCVCVSGWVGGWVGEWEDGCVCACACTYVCIYTHIYVRIISVNSLSHLFFILEEIYFFLKQFMK